MTPKNNAEELALMAQEIGAQLIRGPVRYPGHLGDVDCPPAWPCGGTANHLWPVWNTVPR